MPRVAAGIFAQYYDSAVKLAQRETGVSRPELMKKLHITRLMADRVIEHAGLESVARVGRTPPAEDTMAEEIQSLDKQIVEVRKLLAADFSEKAKIETRIAGHQALLTALLTQHVTS